MNFTGYIKKLTCFIVLFTFLTRPAKAIETEIRYRITGVKEVFLIWGVNDWQRYPKPLPNTSSKGKTMRTAMVKEGDEYVARLDIDPGYVVDYGFMFVKIEGPFNAHVDYWDMDDGEGTKGYFIKPGEQNKVSITPDLSKIPPKISVPLTSYGKYLLLLFGLSGILLFILRKYYYKKPKPAFTQFGYFVAVTGGLALLLFFVRAYVAGILKDLLFTPFGAVWQMFAATWDDMKYVLILFAFFGLLFLWLKRFRRTILVTYSIVVLLSVIAALANIRIMDLLGRPFNYQWLYYSGFLKSTDASLAFAANVNWQFFAGIIVMLVTTSAITWVLYQLYLKKNLPVVLLFPLLLVLSLLAQFNSKVPALKAANPVLFFVRSAFSEDASSAISKDFAGKSDFDVKYRDSLPAEYAGLFAQHKIKNVVFVVLESTPWEYVAPYSNTIKATPFLDEYKNKAVFESIYAHIPATNKSMFAFLCSAYPEISFKSITLENPDIELPSIPSELKKHGYRSAFFNSGDNQYQNAIGFLKAREFDTIEDFHDNSCGKTIFSDARYKKHKSDGVDDSCLSVSLFNWIAKDTARPFFAMMWTFQTHYPYFVSGPQKDYKTNNPSLEKYLNALHRADETIRDIVKGLEQRNLLESTLIVVCGDHGEAFGRHDQTTHAAAAYEENLHVPLILINPSLFKGERIAATGGISDIAPTIFSVLNKPAPELWQGEDLFSVNRRKRVYFFNPYSDYLFGLREGNLKLIFNATDNTYHVYDLAKDPRETTDVAKDNEAFIKEAGEKLHAWMYYQDQYIKRVVQPKNAKEHK